jgi:Rod binding domain-containing protein
MSDLSAQNLTALGSTVLPTVLPPDVRKAGPKGEQLYKAALGFEQMLTMQLTDQLAKTMQGADGSDGSDGSGDSSSANDPSSQSIFPSDSGSSSMVGQMLPQALSDGITQAGGLGIAHQLYLMLAQATGLSAATGSAGSGSGGSTGSAASGGTAGGGQ